MKGASLKAQTLMTILAALITFLVAITRLLRARYPQAIIMLALAVILFGVAGTLRVRSDIEELKNEFNKKDDDTAPE